MLRASIPGRQSGRFLGSPHRPWLPLCVSGGYCPFQVAQHSGVLTPCRLLGGVGLSGVAICFSLSCLPPAPPAQLSRLSLLVGGCRASPVGWVQAEEARAPNPECRPSAHWLCIREALKLVQGTHTRRPWDPLYLDIAQEKKCGPCGITPIFIQPDHSNWWRWCHFFPVIELIARTFFEHLQCS